MDRLHESQQSLWLLTFGPALWFVHFMLCYVTAAVWCAKVAGSDGALDGARTLIGVYTVVALAGIALVGRVGYRRHQYGDEPPPHDQDTPEDRHRFLGFSTFLLCGLSAVATAYVAVVALFFRTCR